jgi:hypothetical protein
MILKKMADKSLLEWLRKYSNLRTILGINSRSLKEKRYYKKGAELRKEEMINKRRVIFNAKMTKKSASHMEEKSL